MAPSKRTFTREELHDLVWSTPILKLAEEFGISDRGFTKICSRHLVPTPPRGYWAKIEAGLPAKKTPLRSVENKALHNVEIGTRAPRSETVLAAITVAKAERKLASAARAQLDVSAGEMVPSSRAIEADQRVEVPHKVVAQITRQLERARPDSDGVISATGLCVHERTRERAINILHHLAKAADANAAKLLVAGKRLQISTSQGSADVTLTEERRRPKHIPTEAELAEYQRLKAKRAKSREHEFWFERLEPWPEFDIVYTGKLTIGYDGHSNHGLRKSWSDGKSQTVERCLADFIIGMRTIISAQEYENLKREEQERLRHHMRRRRELSSLRAERETKRLACLEEIAAARRKLADMRLTVEAVPKSAQLPPDYARMIVWAKQQIDKLEAQTTIEAIQATLIDNDLFPKTDNLFDPEGDPPPKQGYWGA